MTTFLDFFKVPPPESLDFLNLQLEKDTKVFLDPYSVAMTNNVHCRNAHKCIKAFMKTLLTALKDNNQTLATELCSHFQEPKGTGIGWTKKSYKGRGAGEIKAAKLLEALTSSEAVMSGAIEDLEELILVVEGLGLDTISDITINLGMKHFIEFTQEKCNELNIPLERINKKVNYFCHLDNEWKSDFFDLPHALIGEEKEKGQIILLPINTLAKQSAYGTSYFFTNIATPYFVNQGIAAGASFIRATKSGGYKADLKKMRENDQYKGGKKRMGKFITDHPEALKEYREKVAFYRYKKNHKKD
ncbi:UNVERIFIED_CONTAM: hypothetical protein KWE62_08680 [Acinetobacter baumannii]|nr:hypothetical protein [Acinetobacter baumannii]ENW50002.1 hypothetical protein F918_02640 [Acinetobacter baumannii NIPH 601]MBJ9936733.1 hypothetical protein [Acinetobacter pittii]HAV4232378.1 hypothetical protein [Acinetobacter baumannii ATCC 17978]EKU3411101.1 hypothetical protein [Acinetobacter baumannii]